MNVVECLKGAATEGSEWRHHSWVEKKKEIYLVVFFSHPTSDLERKITRLMRFQSAAAVLNKCGRTAETSG